MMGGIVSRNSPLWLKIEQQAAKPKPVIIPLPAAVTVPRQSPLAEKFQAAHKLADTYLYGPDGKRRITRHEIVRRVCWLFGITETEIKSSRRHARIVKARHYAIYLMCRHSLSSTPEMGISLGGRDHTTVLHAMNLMAVARNKTLGGRTPEIGRAALERHARRWRVYHANEMRWRA